MENARSIYKKLLIIAIAIYVIGTVIILSDIYIKVGGIEHILMETSMQYGHQHERIKGETLELSGRLENGVRIVEVKAYQYKFEPDPIVVRLGEKVRLVVTSTDVSHGIAISEFNINVPVPAGKTEDIEFTADKKGTFLAYCSVYCGQGHRNMKTKLVVEE